LAAVSARRSTTFGVPLPFQEGNQGLSFAQFRDDLAVSRLGIGAKRLSAAAALTAFLVART
jgi:hypothetical protein